MADSRPESSIARVPVSADTRAPGGTTNAYVAGGLLVDPAARADALDDAVGLGGNGDGGDPDENDVAIDAIAVTHTHPDHVGAVAEYAEFTGASVFAHADHVDRFAEATGTEPDGTFAGGERVGPTAVRAVDTPGHAPDHVAFAVTEGRGGDNEGPGGDNEDPGGDNEDPGGDGGPPSRALLCGDLAVAEGSVAVAAPEGDLREYLDSLDRVREAGYDRLYPGHGPVIDDPKAVCDRLIGHRLERERAVLAAIEGGADDVDAVVDAAYEKDLTGVADLARATVVAHLEKLAAEGRVDGSWSDPSP